MRTKNKGAKGSVYSAVGEGESAKITRVHLWHWPSTIKRLRPSENRFLEGWCGQQKEDPKGLIQPLLPAKPKSPFDFGELQSSQDVDA